MLAAVVARTSCNLCDLCLNFLWSYIVIFCRQICQPDKHAHLLETTSLWEITHAVMTHDTAWKFYTCSIAYMHISNPMDPLWYNVQVTRFQSERGKRIPLAYFYQMTSRLPQALTPLEHTGSGSMSKHVQWDLAKATLYGWWATSRLNWTGLPWTCWKETSSRQDSLTVLWKITDIHGLMNAFEAAWWPLSYLSYFRFWAPHSCGVDRKVMMLMTHDSVVCTLMHAVFHCRTGEWHSIIIQIGKPPLSASCNPDLDLHLFNLFV